MKPYLPDKTEACFGKKNSDHPSSLTKLLQMLLTLEVLDFLLWCIWIGLAV